MITIITVNHDTPRFIELCIKAVHLRTRLPYKHLVLDNGSSQPTLTMLRKFKDRGWIELVQRRTNKCSRGHAEALDWVLSKRRFDLVCLLDSDAYPVDVGWLNNLYDQLQAQKATAIGFPHFRDGSLLHPACMLFRFGDFVAAGRPSFHIQGTLKTKFWDTGMIVCREMRRRGKLVPYGGLGKLVKHRWCATRAELAGGRIDDTPIDKFRRASRNWFMEPCAVEALKHS